MDAAEKAAIEAKVNRFFKHPILENPISKTLSYAALGNLVASKIFEKIYAKKKHEELMRMANEDTIDVKDYLSKNFPSIKHLGSREDVSGSERLTVNEINLLNKIVGKPDIHHAQSLAGDQYLVSPAMISRHALGHEIGHALTQPNVKETFIGKHFPDLSGHVLAKETAAWEASPISTPDKIKNKYLDLYKSRKDFSTYGTAAGAVAGLGLSIPLIRGYIRALRK